MKKLKLLVVFNFLLAGACWAQTALVDNMPIASNPSYTITPGAYNIADVGNDGIINIANKSNVVIDAMGVTTTGTGFTGYVVYISNCDSIQARNRHASSPPVDLYQ